VKDMKEKKLKNKKEKMVKNMKDNMKVKKARLK